MSKLNLQDQQVSKIKNTNWINGLRVWATLGVIFIHVSSVFVNPYDKAELTSWYIGNFYDSFFRFSVPIFFMISGQLLFSHDYKLKNFLRNAFLE